MRSEKNLFDKLDDAISALDLNQKTNFAMNQFDFEIARAQADARAEAEREATLKAEAQAKAEAENLFKF